MRRPTGRSFELATLAFVSLAPTLVAQNGSLRATVPSPTAAGLGKFGDVPVSLTTGVPDISIPLFTAKGRTLDLPIVLKYHSAGVKVEEIGGWAGIGWTLEAGGAITRTVRGQADLEVNSGYYHTGNQWWQGTNWSNPTVTFLQQVSGGAVDGDPDQYFFSFGGRSGEFVMGPIDAAGSKAIQTVPYQKLNIVPQIVGTIPASVTSWTTTAEDGTKYTFGAVETTTDKTPPPGSIPGGGHLNETHNSTWHLTRVDAPGGDFITLAYTPYTVTHRMGSYQEKFDHVTFATQSCAPSGNFFNQTTEHQITVQRLTSITTAAHTITFAAGPLRTDALSPTGVAQEPTLDLITVATPSGTVIRKFKLVYDYSTGRLTLKQVFEQDASNVQLPPYAFTYDPFQLPARTSFAVDHWGFGNGITGNTTFYPAAISSQLVSLPGADRTPNPAFARAGILTKITYPTGGSSEFIYEGNTFGGVGGASTAPIVPGPQQNLTAVTPPNPSPHTQALTITGVSPTILFVTANITPDCPTGVGCPFVEVRQGSNQLWVTTTAGITTTAITISPGAYTLTASRGAAGGPVSSAQIDVTWRPNVTDYQALGGGLRVAEVRTNDGFAGSVTYTKYNYAQTADPTKSSGIVNAMPEYSYSYTDPACQYFSRSSTSKMPLGGGPPVVYREVTVSRGATGQFGKTVHKFRSIVEAPDQIPQFGADWPFSTVTTYEWKRGQTLEATSSNASGQIQRKTTSTFAFRDEGTPEPITTRKFRGMSINAFAGGFPGSVTFAYNGFEVISAWSYQDGETETVYDESGASSFATSRSFVYGNPNHVQLTETTETNSNGTQRITRMKYPADYATGSGNPEAVALTAMQGATVHMHSPVIERWVVEKVGTVERVMRGEITTFKAFGAWYLPFQRFILNNPVPIP